MYGIWYMLTPHVEDEHTRNPTNTKITQDGRGNKYLINACTPLPYSTTTVSNILFVIFACRPRVKKRQEFATQIPFILCKMGEISRTYFFDQTKKGRNSLARISFLFKLSHPPPKQVRFVHVQSVCSKCGEVLCVS